MSAKQSSITTPSHHGNMYPMNNLLPLMIHQSAEDIVAFRHGEAITVRQFLADVARLRTKLLPGKHVINICRDRYRFMVGLAAVMTANKISLLPSTYTHETIKQMLLFAPDVFCLSDGANDIELPQLCLPECPPEPVQNQNMEIPLLPENLPVSYVFTSGSSGDPVPHLKTWGALVYSIRAEAQRLGMLDGRPYTVLGTVPPQHMYGLESTILLVLQSGGAISAPQLFYPADIRSELSSLPRPRILVSTPIHLRALLHTSSPLPSADLLVSATAPLNQALAEEAENYFDAPLQEIYGSTETGVIATRRSAKTDQWSLLPEIRLAAQGGCMWASGGHLEQATVLNDRLEIINDAAFLLHGRTDDLVNIAGKRSSLAYLNHQLNTIPEVKDGVFFMPDDGEADKVKRLMAFVVAPDVDAHSIYTKLRERIDPAFLPRPLQMVDSLPRNHTGKLPRDALRLLATAEQHVAEKILTHHEFFFSIPAQHPMFIGHFPGHPIVPGVILIDEIIHILESESTQSMTTGYHIAMTKFYSPVSPGEIMTICVDSGTDGRTTFEIHANNRRIAAGALSPASKTSIS